MYMNVWVNFTTELACLVHSHRLVMSACMPVYVPAVCGFTYCVCHVSGHMLICAGMCSSTGAHVCTMFLDAHTCVHCAPAYMHVCAQARVTLLHTCAWSCMCMHAGSLGSCLSKSTR
jgi:hypothetical protein